MHKTEDGEALKKALPVKKAASRKKVKAEVPAEAPDSSEELAPTLHIDATVKVDGKEVRGTLEETEGPARQLSAEEEFMETVRNPEVRANALQWANLINERFHGNWFTIEKIQKKTALKDINKVAQVLNVLIFMDMCHGKTERGVKQFKIILNQKDKIELLREDLRILDERRKALCDAIARLEAGSIAGE